MSSFCFLYAIVFLLFVIIYSVITETKVSNQIEELEFWNDPRLNYRKYNQRMIKDTTLKHGRTYVKQNNGKHKKVINGKTIKLNKAASIMPYANTQWTTANITWPKVAPRFRVKTRSTRITRMMLQEAEDTSTPYTPLVDDEYPEKLSPYSIKKQLQRISSKFPNTNITIDVIGRTVEYNDIVLMKISELSDLQRHFRAEDDKYADEGPQKKIIFIVHGLSVMGQSLLEQLCIEDKFMKLMSYYMAHLNNFDIFLIPLANPDGYGKARYDILWNKNMSPQNACPGVNVDRNFDVAWNSSSVISSCSQHYPGSAPFSEAESRAIRDVFHKYSHKIVAYIHVHGGSYDSSSYKGEAVLYPKGYSEVQSDDDKYIDLRGEIDEAMRNASFQMVSVTVDTLHSWYGRVLGTSVDYASTVYGIPYSLEMVMQLYADYYMDTDETHGYSALNEIWSRVVDVIFKNIWKNTHSSDVLR